MGKIAIVGVIVVIAVAASAAGYYVGEDQGFSSGYSYGYNAAEEEYQGIFEEIEEMEEVYLKQAYDEGYNKCYWDSEPDDEGLEYICGFYEWAQESMGYDKEADMLLMDIIEDYDAKMLQDCEEYWSRHGEVIDDSVTISSH